MALRKASTFLNKSFSARLLLNVHSCPYDRERSSRRRMARHCISSADMKYREVAWIKLDNSFLNVLNLSVWKVFYVYHFILLNKESYSCDPRSKAVHPCLVRGPLVQARCPSKGFWIG